MSEGGAESTGGGETSLERVIEGLHLGEEFGLHVVSCATEAQAAYARARLSAETGDVPLVFTEVAAWELGEGGPRTLVDRLLHHTACGVLVLSATVMPEYPDRWALVFQRLNEARDRISACFDGLVLLILEPLKSVLAHNAADFWSIRSSSVVLEAEPEQEEAFESDGEDARSLHPLSDVDSSVVPRASVRGAVAAPPVPALESLVDADEDADDRVLGLDDDELEASELDEAAPQEAEVEVEVEPDMAPEPNAAPAPEPAPSLAREQSKADEEAASEVPRSWEAQKKERRRDLGGRAPSSATRPSPPRLRKTASMPPPKPRPESAAIPAASAAPAPAPPPPISESPADGDRERALPGAPAPVKRGPVAVRGRSSLLDAALHKLRTWTGSVKARAKGSPPAEPLTVLLLSSLHATAMGKAQMLLDERLRALVGSIDGVRHESALSPFELMVVAGDVTARGKPDELVHARELLLHLVRRLAYDGRSPALVLVPGNHEVPRGKPGWRTPIATGHELDMVMRQRQNLGFAKKTGHDYRMLVQKLHEDGVVPRAPQMDPYTLLGLEWEHEGRRLALRGLDSTWALPWTSEGKGLLGSQQLAHALAGLEDADLRVAVVHHVRSRMDPQEWDVLDDAFDLVLTGAGPEDSESVGVTSRGTVVVQSPGLVGTSSPGYAILELGVTLRVRICRLYGDHEPMVYELPWSSS